MWHWNSLWAPAPGDPPAVDDPALWRSPWSVEQAIALQARQWEALLSATHSWWSMLLSTLPAAPAWPIPAWTPPEIDPAATTGIEPLVAKPPVKAAASPRKRSAAPTHHSVQARKR
ncbi:MAG TPA: hypothetical protein VHQ87_18000 [Rhizobacter sp.]|jgi:hypothetical protein|nr:hypothetical protein [Rhizobacter sp.]